MMCTGCSARTWRLVLPFVLVGGLVAGCGGNKWDYVALGDSTPAGFGVERSYVDYYAEFIELDLDTEVEVHNFSRSGQTVATMLKRIQGDEDARAALRDAEVITVWTGWNDLRNPLDVFRAGTCGGQDNLDCVREAVEVLNGSLDSALDEIVALASPDETLIRVADTGIHLVSTWQYHGWFETLQGPCYEVWREHLVEAAEARGITVVYTYHVLNGPDGDEKTDGIYLDDGIHFNDAGHRLVAELHREAGYAYAP
ncbi:MAG: SGNH/GDSL hydrolase family protein [Anaerolineae bacterium]|jgi:lysophospholipase L1-like esterase